MEAPNSPVQTAVSFPGWLVRFSRRVLHLPPGRYQIIITVSNTPDWSVIWLGEIENASGPPTTTGDAHRTT